MARPVNPFRRFFATVAACRRRSSIRMARASSQATSAALCGCGSWKPTAPRASFCGTPNQSIAPCSARTAGVCSPAAGTTPRACGTPSAAGPLANRGRIRIGFVMRHSTLRVQGPSPGAAIKRPAFGTWPRKTKSLSYVAPTPSNASASAGMENAS